MNAKIEKLREWGCDIDSAMRRMLGDENFYIECLGALEDDKNFEKLGQALMAGDASASFESAHTIKGILANLGVTPMYKKIIRIVEEIRSGNNKGGIDDYDELMKMKEYLAKIMK